MELLTIERDRHEGTDGLGFGVCPAKFGWVVGKILRKKQLDPNFLIILIRTPYPAAGTTQALAPARRLCEEDGTSTALLMLQLETPPLIIAQNTNPSLSNP